MPWCTLVDMETPIMEIRNVRVRAEQDEALEALAPPYLKGSRKCELRIQWALDEYLKTRRDAEAKREKEGQQ